MIQLGLNAAAIFGGIVVNAVFSASVFAHFMSPELAKQLSFICSFSLVTGMFILFTDLTQKHIALISQESYAVKIINPMRFCLLVWLFSGLVNVIFRMLKLPIMSKNDITSDDIYTLVEAGRWPACCSSKHVNALKTFLSWNRAPCPPQ